MDEICQVRPPLHTLKIWGAGVYSPRSYWAEFVFFCFFCLFVRHAPAMSAVYGHQQCKPPRRCVYALNLGGTGISPPDSFRYRSNFRFRSSFRSRFRSRSNFRSSYSFSFRFSYRSSSTTSGDIFYCSGSRQLNHSSCLCRR